MANGGGGGASFFGREDVRIAVIGDQGTGKTSLILSMATYSFQDSVPGVVPPARLPADLFPDAVPLTIVDTSSSPENAAKLVRECLVADAIIVTYACDRRSTLDRLNGYWLPELRRLKVNVPVIVVGCKLDLGEENRLNLENLMHNYQEIETCIECSSLKQIQIPDVFCYAKNAVLHPSAPLFDRERNTLTERYTRALKRIFILCDIDRDGALSDAELNEFQVKCFNAPLQESEVSVVKNVVQEKMPEGVNENGLTLAGFLFLHAMFIEHGRLETTWAVLRKFGYNNEIELREDELPISFKRAPDQSVELTVGALDFLRGLFDNAGNSGSDELAVIFSTAPESPWKEHPYKDAAAKNSSGGLSLEGFLSEWALMTLLNPMRSLAYLIYTGFPGDAASAFNTTRRRRLDRKRKQTQRNVFQCFVFGSEGSGKSALLNALIGRNFSETYTLTAEAHFAANIVDMPAGGIRKTLIMREIPEREVPKLLSSKESLACCDVAVFVHDRSDEISWKGASELLLQVATHGENSGYEVPCLIVSTKDDLDPHMKSIQDSTMVSQAMGIEAPIPVSMKLQNHNNVFRAIINAAQHPHLGVPETEAGKARKKSLRLVNRSLVALSVGAAAAMVGLTAYRSYAARRNNSS